ncbi:MAG TPA: DNA polymerase III subunit delta' [Pseudorhodoplanes sp.]|nr:DNA polymerase III subunit delta' [Pseudorhodoplanes sp.]
MSDADEGDVASDTPHPRRTTDLFGHAEAEAAMLDAYRGGRVPHAWLIGGLAGIGKATLAYRFARFALTHPDPAAKAVQDVQSLAIAPDHPMARRVAAQGHPDVLVLERTIGDTGKLRSVITVDQVRKTVPFFGSTAGEGGWRIVIVDAVDELNTEGENALLKLLEEPPAKSMLLLVTHTPGRVRATLRSRCRRLALRPLAADDVARAAAAALGEPPAKLRDAAAAADGSVARAIALLDGDALKFRERVQALLERLPDVDARALHALGDSMGGADPAAFEGFVDTLNDWMSARLRSGPQDAAHLARVADAWQRINRAADEANEYNLDRRPVIFDAFGALAEAARG